MKLYHYTNIDGLNGIINSGHIKKTNGSGKNAQHGPGVYLSSISPNTIKSIIARKNYRAGWRKNLNEGRLDMYVAMEFVLSNPNLEQVDNTRQIWLYRDIDILLADFDYIEYGRTGGTDSTRTVFQR